MKTGILQSYRWHSTLEHDWSVKVTKLCFEIIYSYLKIMLNPLLGPQPAKYSIRESRNHLRPELVLVIFPRSSSFVNHYVGLSRYTSSSLSSIFRVLVGIIEGARGGVVDGAINGFDDWLVCTR